MDKMIGVINDNLLSVISGISEHKIDVENTISQINQEIETRRNLAEKYKNEILDAKNTINDLESNIQNLNVQLADLNARYGNEFKEIASAAAREFNNKIKSDTAIISTNTKKIIETTELVNNLKTELESLNQQKAILEEDYNKTLILNGFYESKINEIIDFTINHPDELEGFAGISPVILNKSSDLEDKDLNIDDEVFNEIDKISSTEPDKSLVNSVMENVNSFEIKEDKKDSFEDISLTRQLDDVIKEANDIILKTKTIDDYKEDIIEIPSVSRFENAETPILKEEDFLTSSLSTLGLDVGAFRKDDLEKLTSTYNEEVASKVLDVLRKYNIDINYVTSTPEILTMDDNELDNILEILTKNGLNIKNVVYYINVIPYIDSKKLKQISSKVKDKELTEIIYNCVGDDGGIYIDRYISMSEAEVERLRRHSTEVDFRIINMFPEIVVENFNTLVNFKVDKASECLLDHPHRFIFNPDKFADILDKYELDDLIRCINKNPGVIDKL